MSRCALHRTRDRGQSLVELAIVTPFLLLLLMGAIDVGRLLFASVAVEEAAQEGALYAALEPLPSPTLEEAIRARVVSSSDAPEVTGASVTACTTPDSESITVTVQYDYPLITPLIREMLGDTVSIGSSVTATDLQGTC